MLKNCNQVGAALFLHWYKSMYCRFRDPLLPCKGLLRETETTLGGAEQSKELSSRLDMKTQQVPSPFNIMLEM